MANDRSIRDAHMLRVDTVLTDDHRVLQTLDTFGEVSWRVANVAAMQMDKGIREQLIRLGWTPPPGNGGSNGR